MSVSLVPTNSDNTAWRTGVSPHLHAVAHHAGGSPLVAGDVPWPVLWSGSCQSFQAPQPCPDWSWCGYVYPGSCQGGAGAKHHHVDGAGHVQALLPAGDY